MNSVVVHLPVLQVLVPLFAAVIIAVVPRTGTAWLTTLVASWLSLFVSVLLLIEVQRADQPLSYMIGGWAVPYGIEYRVDKLSAFLLLVVNVVASALAPYAKASVPGDIDGPQQPWFYSMYLLCLTGLLGMVISGDAFNIFVFMEISSLSTYVLIALGRNRKALLASYQYLIVGTIGATFYVIGVGLLYLATGSLNLVDIASRLTPAAIDYARPIYVALAFLAVGISLKLALFPLHVWLPNAYAYAPSAVSAFLAGSATKVAVYLLARLYFSVFGPVFGLENLPVSLLLLALSLTAMMIASFSALFEANAKRMMAYSSVAQIGYITLGIALANVNGLTGGLTHLANHAIAKSALFMALGTFALRAGTVQFSELQGIGRRLPLTSAAFVICGLSLIGIPGTAGFISKWYLIMGALELGYWPVAFLIVASSLLAVIYIGRFVEAAYFHPPSDQMKGVKDPSHWMLVPLLGLTFLCIYLGFETTYSAGLARQAAEMLLAGVR